MEKATGALSETQALSSSRIPSLISVDDSLSPNPDPTLGTEERTGTAPIATEVQLHTTKDTWAPGRPLKTPTTTSADTLFREWNVAPSAAGYLIHTHPGQNCGSAPGQALRRSAKAKVLLLGSLHLCAFHRAAVQHGALSQDYAAVDFNPQRHEFSIALRDSYFAEECSDTDAPGPGKPTRYGQHHRSLLPLDGWMPLGTQ